MSGLGQEAHGFIAGVEEGAVYDLIVLGAGASGMAAALFAALEGKKVLLIERTEYLGGSSAYSAATTWIPNTLHSEKVGAKDSFENALMFLDQAVGNRASRTKREAFLKNGPKAIERLEKETEVHFRARPLHPDYLFELEGATAFGRAIEPLPYSGKMLGADFALIRPPIPEFTILGGMMIDRDDIGHLLAMGKKVSSAIYSAKLILSYLLDRLQHPRGTRLVMGNALIGRMLRTLRDSGVDIATKVTTKSLITADGRVEGVIVEQGGVARSILARCGVVLASGGFSRHPERRATYLPKPVPEYSPAAPGHTGELHDIVMALGAHYGEGEDQPCFWAPVSVRQRKDGTTAVFPHFVLDRSKPGILSVGRDGLRFVNESRSYHEFASAMFARNKDGSHIPAYLITDSEGLRKYGLGMVRPGGKGLQPFLDDGYLTQGETLDDLAGALNIDANGLKTSVTRMNGFAESGVDEDFHRGETVYERANGDAKHEGPNPTLGALKTAPYYAVRLYPGDIGAAKGLETDENARVLRKDGGVIEGLYAVGNDAQSIMGGVYPGPGITIGPGITFGYIAAKHAISRG